MSSGFRLFRSKSTLVGPSNHNFLSLVYRPFPDIFLLTARHSTARHTRSLRVGIAKERVAFLMKTGRAPANEFLKRPASAHSGNGPGLRLIADPPPDLIGLTSASPAHNSA